MKVLYNTVFFIVLVTSNDTHVHNIMPFVFTLVSFTHSHDYGFGIKKSFDSLINNDAQSS